METIIKYISAQNLNLYVTSRNILYVIWKKYIAHGPLIALSLPGITLLTITAQPWQNLEGSQE